MIPQAIGHFQIKSKLGEGGMGEVYLATDDKLGREVAIKVLPAAFADDSERVSRLAREARVLALLNHKNIANIYSVEDGALVMEYVEGATLEDLLSKGSLSARESLRVATQVAEALDAAHEKGIVHRDLKPANIKIARDGTVKVLDFGLASITEQIQRSDSQTRPTVLIGETRPGLVLGTVPYMSPEQARAVGVDKRTDIWSFGVLIYEMLTGRRPFAGKTASDIIAAILTTEPDWKAVPQEFRRLLRRCLDKDPRKRIRDIGDVFDLLPNSDSDASSTSRVRIRLLWLVGSVILTCCIGLAAGAMWLRSPVRPDPVRVSLDLGAEDNPLNVGADTILSPDGNRLTFVSNDGSGTRHLYARLLDEGEARLLPGTDGAYAPFYSPTGEWIGFFANGKLKKVRWDGGDPVTLCEAPAGRGGSWGDDDTIVAALDSQAGLSRISSAGGKPGVLTEKRAGENSHRWPHVLPGSKAALFTLNSTYANFDDAQVGIVDLSNGHRSVLLEHAGMYPQYAQSGHLVYVSKGRLLAAPFDVTRLKSRGSPSSVLDEVSSNPVYGFAQVSLSKSGALLYRKGRTEGLRTINWLKRDGKTEPLVADPGLYQFPRFSPDGKRLATVAIEGSSSVIWIYDVERGGKTKLPAGTGVNTSPVWTPDGRFVVYQAPGGMFWNRVDGTGEPASLTKSEVLQFPTSFSPDGRYLVFAEANPGPGANLRTVVVEQSAAGLRAGTPELLVRLPSLNAFAAFSPDGRWIAYASAESGNYEVYVRRFPDDGSQTQMSVNGGTMPVWSPASNDLYYRTEDERIMTVSYSVEGTKMAPSKPREWCSTRLANLGLTPNFDLFPAGGRFAVLMPSVSRNTGESRRRGILIIQFVEELRRRIPA